MRGLGYSLASIFLLTIVVAVVSAAAGTAVLDRDRFNPETLAVCAIIGGVVGLPVGAAVGLGRTQRAGGTLLGIAAGVVAGAVAGGLLSLPGKLPALAVGSVVLVAFAVVVRRFSAKTPWQ